VSNRAVGVLLGLGAAGAFEVAYLLMAAQARRVSAPDRPDARFLVSLIRRRWWLAAMALNGVAFALELLALRRVSLVIVQPLLAVGLVGLVLGARAFLGEPVGVRELAATTAVVVGVTLVVVGAPGGPATFPFDQWSDVAVGGLVVVLAVPQFSRRGSAWWLVTAAAAGDTLVALATNVAAGAWTDHLPLALVGTVAVAVCGLSAVTCESAALQRLPVSRVGPIVSGVQVTLPVLLVALLGRQSWASTPGRGLLLALGVAVVGAGALCLGASDIAGIGRRQER